ncbi:MAG: RNA 2',3'-cyclic phosphodiesterase [Spirochaetes bacterium]|nr:RNA 2',3'-cyclic phosphodiesterase [Spirochaetota bacterium]
MPKSTDQNKRFRLFIAIPLPDQIKEKIVQELELPKQYRSVKMDQFHITLLFLGDVEKSLINSLKTELANTIQGFSSFSLTIDHTGCFPPMKEKAHPFSDPKIIYVSGNKGSKKVTELANQIRNGFFKLGFQDKKAFRYHITIARLKYPTHNNFQLPQLEPAEFTVDRIILYQSTLTPQGPIYQELSQTNLK